MTGRRAFRSVLVSVILVVLGAAPAYPWHGTGLITALAIDPVTPTTLYAGTVDRGVFRSTDGGASWSATGLTNIFVWSLGVDPSNPNTLYAGTHSNGVLKSTDGGASWIPTGPTTDMVQALAIDPQNPNTVYAGAINVYKSADGGASWSFSGLSDGVQALAIDPLNPTTLYAGTDINPYGWDPETIRGGVFKSPDEGASWSPTGLANIPVSALAIDPQTPTTLYAAFGGQAAGVLKSTDGGASWSAVDTGLTNLWVGALAIDPLTPTTLYAGTGFGVFKSTDGGATWSAVNAGLTNTVLAFLRDPDVRTLAVDPVIPTTLYAGTNVGVFKSTDGGASWSPTGLIQHSPLSSVSLTPDRVSGGTASTGTVTLIAAAPADGVEVSLSSDNTAVATVPASVTVPAGATSANFTVVSTSAVTVYTGAVVKISAAFDGLTRYAWLVVMPATTLSSLSLNPTSVTGGSTSTGTVTLSSVAPTGGVTVMLSSGNPYVATVPASVAVPTGATSASFTVSTSPVANPIGFEIAGTYGGLTASARLTVTPATTATLYSLSLNDASVPGGAPLAGTVTLTAAAPAGGAVVTLASSSPAVATVPTSVTVAAGATSANFTVSTNSLTACASSVATISATYSGVTRSAGLTVTPTTDTVAIQQADYFANRHELRVAATSTGSTATLQVYVTSTGDLIGTLKHYDGNRYSGRFTWSVNPQNIAVRSSLCGSATSGVTLK